MRKPKFMIIAGMLCSMLLLCTACGNCGNAESYNQSEIEVTQENQSDSISHTVQVEEIQHVEAEEVEANQEKVIEEEVEQIAKNTYRTKWNDVTTLGDTFLFDYPDNWTITLETVQDYDTIAEQVILANERGVEIYYMNYRNLNGNARIMFELDIDKVADSMFVPGYPAECDVDYSYLGDFMVAEVKIVGEMNMDIDSDYKEVDGATFYAVMPTSMEGKHSDIRNVMLGCSFDYVANYTFIAMAPSGKFLEEEKQEVIEILSSFRLEK